MVGSSKGYGKSGLNFRSTDNGKDYDTQSFGSLIALILSYYSLRLCPCGNCIFYILGSDSVVSIWFGYLSCLIALSLL